MSVIELLADENWACVFADDGNRSDGNCTKYVESADETPVDPAPTRTDVAQVLALRDGEEDGPDWLGAFLLADGRFLYARGGCDGTGWD